MPTYEYRCSHCGTDFEKFGRMSDPPVEACPSCGREAERRMSAGAGLLFRGSGFYITDYRGEGYRKAAASDSAEGKPEPKGESKPAAKGDAQPAAGKAASKTPPKTTGGGGESA